MLILLTLEVNHVELYIENITPQIMLWSGWYSAVALVMFSRPSDVGKVGS